MTGTAGQRVPLGELIRHLAAYLIHHLARFVTWLVGRREDLWIFGSFVGTPQFSNNSKYLYLHVAQHHPRLRPVWITDSPQLREELEAAGYEVARRWSLAARWLALRAGTVVVDSGLGGVPIAYTGGAVRVQLTHGIPLKGPRRSRPGIEEGGPGVRVPVTVRLRDALATAIRGVEYVSAPSEAGARQIALWVASSSYLGHFERSFPSSTVLITGFPRTDALHRTIPDTDIGNPDGLEALLADLDDHEVVLGYFPTFRDDRDAIEPFDLAELTEFLEQRDAVLLVKSHHDMGIRLPVDHPRVRIVPSTADSSTFLGEIDVMITDYSSIYFDFLHTGDPVILYTFDRPAYEEARGLLPGFDQATAGAIHANTFDELLEALSNLIDAGSSNPLEEEGRTVYQRFFDHRDGRAAHRLMAALAGEGKDPVPPSLQADALLEELEG